MVDNTTNKIGEKNPYRYRSYYYDTETTWYYLNSRYYDPNIGRFITLDEIEYLGATSTILSYNLFTYCEGNPVIYGDDDGNAKELLINLVNVDGFSRSGGNGVHDAVLINTPKFLGESSITVQAKLVVIPVVKNVVGTIIEIPKKIKKKTKEFINWCIDGLGKWLEKLRREGTWIDGGVIESFVPSELPTTRGGSLMGDFDLTCSLDEKYDLWDLPY